MSASEKLKALKPLHSWTYEGIEDDGTFEDEDFRPLLPHIVAVVEWAEKFSHVTDYHGWTDESHPRLEPELDAALSALDEALS